MTGIAADISPTRVLAAFAAERGPAVAPAEAIAAARRCLVDAVACAIFGSRFEWSRKLMRAALLPQGRVALPGTEIRTDAEQGALIAGVWAHAFELDSLRKPGAGVHPGATVALPALMVAQELGRSGAELIEAILAGVEVMFRIGAASLHSAEGRGFHAPGITGVFGSAVAAGRLLRFDADAMANAMALAGSMAGGVLRFAASGDGGMVKRLHLGRAARAGIEAARLAAAGFEGPSGILEGRFGTLDAYCQQSDPALLTAGLGESWEMKKLCLKRYACHVTAQAPIELLTGFMRERGLKGDDIAHIALKVPPKIVSHHAQRHPSDLALAQYSMPFMLAFSAHYDPDDPTLLTEAHMADRRVHDLAQRIALDEDTELRGWSVRMTVQFRSGETIFGTADDFEGSPSRPLDDTPLADRFRRLTFQYPDDFSERLLRELLDIERQADVSRLHLSSAAAMETSA